MSVSINGAIGLFPDQVQQRQVPVSVLATCDFFANGPVPNAAQQVEQNLFRAIREVVSHKMGTRELTFRHLGTGDLAAVVPEILGHSGLAQMGIQVQNLAMSFGIDGHAPPPPKPIVPAGPQHNLNKGTFDLGGGAQLEVSIDGKTPENFLKDKASGMIWGWIIGAVIIGIMVLTAVGFGIYIYVAAKDTSSPAANAKAAAAAKWDGKSTFECGGNDKVTLSGVTATAGVKAGGNCQLTLTGVSITAPVGIEAEANAKVTMTGGSITGSSNSVVASANAKVDLVGTKVTGKAKTSGAAKVSGAN